MKTGAEFDKLVKERCEKIVHTLSVKGKEYRRNDNPFHNFDRVAERRGIEPADALYGMYMKHEQSINDIVDDIKRDGTLPSVEVLEEKIGDAINYLILLEGIIKREMPDNIFNGKTKSNNINSNEIYAICKGGEMFYKGVVVERIYGSGEFGNRVKILTIHPFSGKVGDEQYFQEYEYIGFYSNIFDLNEAFNKAVEASDLGND